jgi:hypothetical protein
MARSKDISSLYRFIPANVGGGVFEECRAVVATAAGTINCVDAAGNSLTALPVVVGVNPYQLTNITSQSAALGLFLGY